MMATTPSLHRQRCRGCIMIRALFVILLLFPLHVISWCNPSLSSTVSLGRTTCPSKGTLVHSSSSSWLICSAARKRRDYDQYEYDDDEEDSSRNNKNRYYDENDSRLEESNDDDNNKDEYDNERFSSRRARKKDDYDADYDDDENEDSKQFSKSTSREPSTSKNDPKNDEPPRRRGGVYRVTFDGDIPTDQVPSSLPEQLEWEVLEEERGGASTYILLPPSHVQRPSAILHFCGATWFGSAPHVWYNPLLQALVRKTNCVVVATSIPITLWRNPLQHKQLALQIQRHFVHAWQDVILDEYYDVFGIGRAGDEDDGGDTTMVAPPVVGVGHSLGARLLIILATLSSSSSSSTTAGTNNNNNNKDRPDRRRGRSMMLQQPPPYQSLILMSFTNYGASVGIPGIQALWQQSRKLERWQEEQDSDTPNRSNRQTGATDRGRNRRRSRSTGRRRQNDDSGYDEYDDEDEDDDSDWGNIWQDVLSVVGEQATRVQSLLTPRSDDLEVYPTPDQLWKALMKEERYNIPQTLLVQFDDDPIDQSSKLANILSAATTTPKSSPPSPQNTTTAASASSTPPFTSRDVKFCRLRGSHLTPIFGSSFSHWLNSKSSKWPSRATKALWKLLRGQPAVEADISMIELRQSVARYITDVVAVAAAEAAATAASNKK